MGKVEKDEHCREAISARIQEGCCFRPTTPIFEDVSLFHCRDVQLEEGEEIDGVAGGFPCQAGAQLTVCRVLWVLALRRGPPEPEKVLDSKMRGPR